MMGGHVPLGELIEPAKTKKAGTSQYPLLSMTMAGGLVDPSTKFKKRVASDDTSGYKVVARGQLVVGFPIDEGVLSFQQIHDEAIVSPAYGIWDIKAGVSIEPSYLEKFLKSPQAVEYYLGKLRSTTARRRSLDRSSFLALPTPLPPLEEQKRIAGILDQADALRRLRARALDKLNTLGQAIFHEMFGDPATDAERWPTAPLANFAAHKDDIKCGPFGTQLLRSEFVDQGVPLWGIKQVNRFFLEPTHEFVSKQKFNTIKQYSIEPNDIVMTRKGTIGNCAVYPDSFPIGVMHSDLLRLRVDPKRHKPEFVADQLRFNRSFGHQLKLISGGAIMAGINVSRLKALHAIAPPLELQCEYAKRVRAIETKTKVHFESQDTLTSLFASLQHRAFRRNL